MSVSEEYVTQQIKQLGEIDSFGTKKEIKHLPEVLRENEKLLFLTSGFYNGTTWLIVATDMRLIFLDKGMFFGLKQVEFPYEKISSIAHKTGLMMASVIVGTSSGEVKIDNIIKKNAPKFCEVVSNYIYSQRLSSQPSDNKPLGDDDIVDKLSKLAELKEKGILTEEEFLQQKLKILG